jgi:DNA-binding MarR family transcriptional regulator
MRLSVLQRRILRWLYADQLRTPNALGSVYRALLIHLPHAPGSITRSLRRLERHELVTLIHAPGGRIQGVRLTTAGHQLVWQLGRDGLQDANGDG